jgi:hypothetical protein
LREILLHMAKNHAALGQWQALQKLLGAEHVDNGLYKYGTTEDFLLLRYAALAAFQLDDPAHPAAPATAQSRAQFSRWASLLDTAYGGNRLSQPERRLVGLAAVLRDPTGNDYLGFCVKMLKSLGQFPDANVRGGNVRGGNVHATDTDVVSQDAPPPPLDDRGSGPLPAVTAATAWTCLLATLPTPSAEADRVIDTAVRLAESANRTGNDPELRAILAAAYMRKALRLNDENGLKQALTLLGQKGTTSPGGFDDFLRARLHAELKQEKDALAALERAQKWRRDPRYLDPALLGPLVDYFEFEVLRAEVLRKIKAGGR